MQTRLLQKSQRGYALLEALLAVLVFSIGVLGMVSLYAVSVKNSAQAKFRTDAGYLANQLIGQMWVDDRDSANLQTNYQGGGGTDGAQYTNWVNNNVQALLPGVTAGLNRPTVTVTPVVPVGALSNKTQVAITLFWQLPAETTPHRYQVLAELDEPR